MMMHLTRRIQRLCGSPIAQQCPCRSRMLSVSTIAPSSKARDPRKNKRLPTVSASATIAVLPRPRRGRRFLSHQQNHTGAAAAAAVPNHHAGLFSVPELQRPLDFSILTQQAIQECNRLRSAVAATVSSSTTTSSSSSSSSTTTTTPFSPHDSIALLHQLDDISKAVCNVIDAAELCRNVHADPQWREAAAQAFSVLSDYISLLNADTTLYRALQLVTQSRAYRDDNHHQSSSSSSAAAACLSEEDRRFAMLLQAEFERDGIHLSDADRDAVRALQNQITQLESSFNTNLVNSQHPFAVVGENSTAVTQVIPLPVLQQMGVEVVGSNSQPDDDDEQQPPPQLILNNNDSQILQTLLKFSPNPALRQQVHREYTTAVPENLRVLDELVRARHELATLQGFDSYVQRNLLDKMAGSAEAVDQFLQTALQQNQTAFRRDMETIAQAKAKVEGGGTAAAVVVEPWDTSFYTGLLTARDGDLASAVAQHLSLPAALNAMQVLVDRLFGIAMSEQPMAEAERWDLVPLSGVHGKTSPPPPEPQRLRKFSFADAEGRPLGTMFLDLHPRPGKYGHAAHFTVRCGCALNYDGSTAADGGHVEYQKPIVALVCNLASTGDGLSHSELETLLHEFGHALHSLLSRTKFQHMSGTRAAMDFVETPSHLIESFAWDPAFLHIAAASPIPADLLQRLQESRYQFAAIERQNQILYAQFDQKLFGNQPPIAGSSSSTPQELFAQLHTANHVPYLPGTHWYTRFGHLVSYGAGYYGYLYSQLFARDIWKTLFEQQQPPSSSNTLSRKAGLQLWHKLLRHGGARDPKIMLEDLLGRPPRVDFSM